MSDDRQPTAGSAAEEGEMIEVFRTSDPALAPVIRSLFAASGIPFEIEGEEIMGLFPFGEFIGGGRRRTLDTIFRVAEGYVEEAESLLETEPESETESESEGQPVPELEPE